VSGAISPDEVKRILSNLGFVDIDIVPKEKSEQIIQAWNVAQDMEIFVFSGYTHAREP
jgi:hypothetical protein